MKDLGSLTHGSSVLGQPLLYAYILYIHIVLWEQGLGEKNEIMVLCVASPTAMTSKLLSFLTQESLVFTSIYEGVARLHVNLKIFVII